MSPAYGLAAGLGIRLASPRLQPPASSLVARCNSLFSSSADWPAVEVVVSDNKRRNRGMVLGFVLIRLQRSWKEEEEGGNRNGDDRSLYSRDGGIPSLYGGECVIL